MRQNAAMSDVTIKTLTDGPLEVTGEVEILASDGSVTKETAKSFLCRCGYSENKPFCDGAHKREGFTAP
jgi:CDGSH-type Zn-finger protein